MLGSKLAAQVAAGTLGQEAAERQVVELRGRHRLARAETRVALSGAQSLLEKGRPAQALAWARLAMTALNGDGGHGPELAVQLSRLAGAAAFDTGDMATADTYLSRSVARAGALPEDSLLRAMSWFEMAKLRRVQGNMQEAARYLGPAEAVFAQQERLDILSRSRLVYGLMLIQIGNFDKSEAILKEGLGFADKIEDRLQGLNYRFALADLAIRRGEMEEAERLAGALRSAAEELAVPASVAQALVLMSMVAERRESLDGANRMMAEAGLQYRALGDRQREAWALAQQARLAELQNKRVDADVILQQAIEVASLARGAILADLLLSRGRLLLKLGRTDEARLLLADAARLFAEQGRHDKVAEAVGRPK